MVWENMYEPYLFPQYNYYVGNPENYLTFLVLRFYDDFEEFKLKIRSVFPFVRIIEVRDTPRFWKKKILLKNTVSGAITELSDNDDPFTTAIKMFKTIRGVEWMQDPIFRKAFSYILPKVIWGYSILTPEHPQ